MSSQNAAGRNGKVYIFNTTNANVMLVLNGHALGALARNAGPGGGYVAYLTVVPRGNAVGEMVFSENNALVIMQPEHPNNNYPSVRIDPKRHPHSRDLLLHIFDGYIVMSDATNNEIVTAQAPS